MVQYSSVDLDRYKGMFASFNFRILVVQPYSEPIP